MLKKPPRLDAFRMSDFYLLQSATEQRVDSGLAHARWVEHNIGDDGNNNCCAVCMADVPRPEAVCPCIPATQATLFKL
jgi:hypothetical protein